MRPPFFTVEKGGLFVRTGMWFLLIALLATGCSSVRSHPASSFHVRPVAAKAIVKTARSQIGKPYRYGGEDPKRGFDCSGLVWWSYQQNGSSIPRSARTQFELGRRVKSTDLQAGDLVFFDTSGAAPSHVGIMVDDERFVHAPSTGEKVRLDTLKTVYWSKHFYGAKRIE